VEGNRLVCQEIETRQLGETKQDHVAQGSYDVDGKTTFWSALFDGHGTDAAIDLIRRTDLNPIMKRANPYEELQQLIDLDHLCPRVEQRLKTGATMVYVKATPNRQHIDIEIVNIGDSTAILFLDDEPIYINELHNYTNGREMVRLMSERLVDITEPIVNKLSGFEVITPTAVMVRKGTYIRFLSKGHNYDLAPSQCLGHNRITGLNPDITHFSVDINKKVRVLLFSDGVDDIMPVRSPCAGPNISFMTRAKDTGAILEEAHKRWAKEWITYKGTNFVHSTLESFGDNGYDDCSCALLEIKQEPSWMTLPDIIIENDMNEEDDEEPFIVFDDLIINTNNDLGLPDDIPDDFEAFCK
jgi:serine/threonine protein phosphatase PrpC